MDTVIVWDAVMLCAAGQVLVGRPITRLDSVIATLVVGSVRISWRPYVAGAIWQIYWSPFISGPIRVVAWVAVCQIGAVTGTAMIPVPPPVSSYRDIALVAEAAMPAACRGGTTG